MLKSNKQLVNICNWKNYGREQVLTYKTPLPCFFKIKKINTIPIDLGVQVRDSL